MKKLTSLPLFLLFLFVIAACDKKDDPTPTEEDENEIPFVEGTKIVFTPVEESVNLLGVSDTYTQSMSKYDIASRTGVATNDKEQQYLDFAAAQVLEWSENEILALKSRITAAKEKIEGLGLKVDLPEEIKVIKSTMKEEGNANGYTRSDYIVAAGNLSEGDLLHELFHLFTRKNETQRDQLYTTIQFNKTNRIDFPASIKDRIITNPDAPVIEHTINLTINGQQQEAVLILYSDKDWDGGNFLNNISAKQKLMLVEGGPNNKTAKLVNGEPVLLELSAATDLYDKIGKNTGRTYHPEEILADHFSLMVRRQGGPNPELLEAMENILKE